MFYLLFLFHFQEVDRGLLLFQRQYLTIAESLIGKAYALEDPVAVREYVVLVTEYYSSQVGWHSFFLKNLKEGEQLELLRLSNQQITMDTNGTMVDPDLEVLLVNAQAKFPNNLDIRFAIASYIFRGVGQYSKLRLEMSMAEVLAVFKEAQTKDIRSAGSMLALHLKAAMEGQFEESDAYLRKGLAIFEEDPELVNANMDSLLRHKNWELAIVQARKLFELTLRPEVKADALVGSARALVGMGQYSDAGKTAFGVYRFLSDHAFALYVGLGAYRLGGGGAPYRDALTTYLNRDVQNPEHFQIYMDYIRAEGVTPDDRLVMEAYAKAVDDEPIASITRLLNQGSFMVADGQKERALELWLKARQLADSLKQAPPDMIPLLDSLILKART